MKYRVKIDINDFLKRYSQIYEEIEYCIGHTEDAIMELDEFYERVKDLEEKFGVPFAELSVINGYLKDIAERAIELKDEKLLEYCEGIGIVQCED